MTSPTIVFMGTPEFAVPSLAALLDEGYAVTAVVTQPDRPKGRKRILTPPPVKVEAESRGIRVLQPERMRSPEAVAALAELAPDLIVTAAYGQILPKAVLELPKFGCINVHGSLLPKYRGGAPIQRAVMNGERVTGVTIMYMAEGLDTGDMISRRELPITDDDTAGTVFEKLSAVGAELLRETLPGLLEGRLKAKPQNEAEATYAPNLKREDERIEWERPAMELFHLVRGLNPQPGAFTTWNGEVFKVWKCRKPEATGGGGQAAGRSGSPPGTVLHAGPDGIEVQTGSGTLWLTQVQPAGRKTMDAGQLVRGGGLAAGTVLGR